MASDAIVGRYSDGLSSRSHVVSVSLDTAGLVVSSESIQEVWPLAEVQLSARLGSSPRQLNLPGGALIEVPDAPLWDELLKLQGKPTDSVVWLESRWRYALGALLGVVVACWAFYLWGLPLCADVLARAIPTEWVSKLSDTTLSTLDHTLLAPTKLSSTRQSEIAGKFAKWASPEKNAPAYRLSFRDGKSLKANALALPSGEIVVTDQLVALAKDDRELLGVLAHELGHLHHRHAIRQVVRGTLLTVAAVVWFGDVGDLTGATSALLTLTYSREFERDADDYAVAMMRFNHVSPVHLASMLERLDPHSSKDSSGPQAYLQSHPMTAERITQIKQQALGN